jgi:aspartyl protease family protein
MNKIFIGLMIAIFATFILLLVNHDRGMTMGMSNDKFASLASLGLVAVHMGLNAFRPGAFGGTTLRNIALWLFIFVGLIAGYQNRFALQDFGSTITAGLIPSRPQSSTLPDGAALVSIGKSDNGHFEVDSDVNGRGVRFLIDTGATSIVLTANDAASIGLDMSALSFTIATSTANGTAMAAPARIDEIVIGSIIRRNLRALVAKEGALDQSLLGMEFLNSLSSFTIKQDQLQLSD